VLVKPRLSPPRVYLSGGVSRSVRVRGHFRTFLERHGMELAETDPARAKETVDAMCRKLLANTVVESYRIELEA